MIINKHVYSYIVLYVYLLGLCLTNDWKEMPDRRTSHYVACREAGLMVKDQLLDWTTMGKVLIQ